MVEDGGILSVRGSGVAISKKIIQKELGNGRNE